MQQFKSLTSFSHVPLEPCAHCLTYMHWSKFFPDRTIPFKSLTAFLFICSCPQVNIQIFYSQSIFISKDSNLGFPKGKTSTSIISHPSSKERKTELFQPVLSTRYPNTDIFERFGVSIPNSSFLKLQKGGQPKDLILMCKTIDAVS